MSETSGTQPAQPESSAAEAPTTGSSGGWDVYFGAPVAPQGSVNWEAYTHEELYQMLWQDADVADVSTIAAEWSQHRAALATHAEVLREQKAALLESWQGSGAEEAARRLDVLAQRVEKIAELAGAGELAAEQAADALAQARAMMPPPPGEASAPMTDAMTSWTDVTSFVPSGSREVPTGSTTVGERVDDSSTAGATVLTSDDGVQPWSTVGGNSSATGMTVLTADGEEVELAPTTSAPSGPDMGMAFGAVGSASFSFYVGADTADMQKQQAIRAMQTYEASLTNSNELIGQAQGTIPAAATMSSSTHSSATTASTTTSTPPSWQSLTAGKTATLAPGAVAGAVVGGAAAAAGLGHPGSAPGSAGNVLGQGMRVGAMSMQSGAVTTAAQLTAESAAARTSAMGGMVPPAAAARGNVEDEQHENQLPTIDHKLFPVPDPGSEAVIGLSPEEAG
ncbi:hypothetical protein [Saccharomonospora sp. NB11]|uniref:hypothetical protein n=1 Tax=Saccharomonospora sp. NB11 TaxID=1642298 RepID=UPI0027DBCBC4|nr:hypothetical protein [Saccharomonospora sp. NB11]